MNTQPHPKPENSTPNCQFIPDPARRGVGALRVGPCGTLLVMAMLLAAASPGLAQSPSAINYQGTLTDNVGNPLPSGSYEIQFKIWNSATSTDAASYIWGRSLAAHVASNGMFNVLIDEGGGVIGSPRTNYLKDAFGDPDRWLGLSIASTPTGRVSVTNEISPRQKLVSAPYALHSSEANTAGLANRAYYAGTATNAINANNATNFGNMTTNDFLWVKKTSQTLSGSLTITNSLAVQGTFTATGYAVFGGDLSALSNSTFHGEVSALQGINVPNGKSIRVGNKAPIEIRTYLLPTISASSQNGIASTNTFYPTNVWSAAVIGWQCHANVEASNDGLYRIKTAPNASGDWDVELAFFHDAASVHEIQVDVMFIRKELVADYR